MNALVRAAGNSFNIGFLIIVLVKEWGRNCSGNAADLHHCAHAAVQDVLFCGGDFGAEDWRGVLSTWYLELQSAIFDSYIFGGKVPRVGRGIGSDLVGADGQSVVWEGVGYGEVDG